MIRTTLYKLRRIKEMREASVSGGTWYVNPKSHPEPKLPTDDHLNGTYLDELRRSSPNLLPEATELIQYVLGGKERRG